MHTLVKPLNASSTTAFEYFVMFWDTRPFGSFNTSFPNTICNCINTDIYRCVWYTHQCTHTHTHIASGKYLFHGGRVFTDPCLFELVWLHITAILNIAGFLCLFSLLPNQMIKDSEKVNSGPLLHKTCWAQEFNWDNNVVISFSTLLLLLPWHRVRLFLCLLP